MSSRTVKFLVILRTLAIYVYLFIYGFTTLGFKDIGIGLENQSLQQRLDSFPY